MLSTKAYQFCHSVYSLQCLYPFLNFLATCLLCDWPSMLIGWLGAQPAIKAAAFIPVNQNINRLQNEIALPRSLVWWLVLATLQLLESMSGRNPFSRSASSPNVEKKKLCSFSPYVGRPEKISIDQVAI